MRPRFDSEPTAEVPTLTRFGSLLTCSPKMRGVLGQLERLTGNDASLLVEGETGVGKELAAESVHRESSRRHGPFLVFDCAEKSVLAGEHELFGAERRGDAEAMPGVLELAAGGTVFLDHVDELAPALQLKLQRAIERRQIRRVGGHASIEIDVRVIAACAGGLRRVARLGIFDHELLLLLTREVVRVPPLRERREDIALIAAQFLAESKPERTLSDIPDSVWVAFRDYRWPGNVRELRNAVQRALLVPDRALAFMRSA